MDASEKDLEIALLRAALKECAPEGELVWMVPPDLAEQVDQYARERGLSRYEALHELVKLGLNEQNRARH